MDLVVIFHMKQSHPRKIGDIHRPLQDEQLNPAALMGQRGNYCQVKFPHPDVKNPKKFFLSEKIRDMQLKAAPMVGLAENDFKRASLEDPQ